MKLCITEKPSVGKDIAEILGAKTRRDGFFEGNGYCVTWTFGHLCELKEPQDYDPRWKRWSLGALPMIPRKFGIKLKDDPGIKHQFEVIEKLIGQCDEVINCGDAGQEGELIQRWVMQKAKCNKPVSRLWISSLTDEAIQEGFKKLRPHSELDPLYMAGLCRAIGDWILGMNATRLYTLKYGTSSTRPLSAGRVQTPTLALVVNRQLEIDNFVPKDYWELKTLYRNVLFSSTGSGYESEDAANDAAAGIRDLPLTITEINQKKGKEAPPRLFDLTSLQVECNRKFGLSADETLRAIQSLYEKKVTTYPRVDTTYLTDDMYPKCGPILNSLKNYELLLQPLRGRKLTKSKKVFDNSKVTDHHAIIPTGQPLPQLSETEMNVFDTVAKRFICVFYPDCEFEQTTIKANVGKTGFKATGRVILKTGWKAVYAKSGSTESEPADTTQDPNDNDTAVLPKFDKGESGPNEPQIIKKTTQPPKYFTEGTLLKAMETAGNFVEDEDLRESLKANGIGRPSTRAAIIETLYRRGYIRKERKSLRATQAGIEFIGLIKEELLKSAKLTGIWENRLRKIEQGEYSSEEFICQLKQMINDIVISVLSDNSNRRIANDAKEVRKEDKPKKRNSKK